jgi:lipid A disaccharide synthetase
MLGVYRATRLGCLTAKLMLKTPYRLLPNIVAGQEIVPEYVPYCGGAPPLAQKILYLLEDSRHLEAQRAAQRVTLAKFKGPAFAPTCVDVLEDVMKMGKR